MAPKQKAAAPKKRGGGRKPAKETKDETVEVSTGLSLLMGDNGPPNKDLIYHLEQISGYIAKAKAAGAKVTEAKKRAKEANVDVPGIMQMLAEEKMDPLELATRLKQKAKLYAERGMPVQMSLYEPAYGSIEDQAKAEGWADGKAARNMNLARWPEGSPGHVEYSRRWNDAQHENASKIEQA